MSKHRRHWRRPRKSHGHIDRVVRGLSDAFGVDRWVVITAFVLGFVFAPLLTAAVFCAAWYWATYPKQARAHLEWLSGHARRVFQRLVDATFERRGPRVATEPDFDTADPVEPASSTSASDLRQRFEALDRRAEAIEAFIASEEYRLEREFRRIDD